MPTVDAASPREGFEGARAVVASLRKDGRVSAEVDAVIRVLLTLLDILTAVPLERTSRRTNSSLPPSRTDRDGTARRGGGNSGRGDRPNLRTGDSLRRTTVRETVAVDACGTCGLSTGHCSNSRQEFFSFIISLLRGRREFFFVDFPHRIGHPATEQAKAGQENVQGFPAQASVDARYASRGARVPPPHRRPGRHAWHQPFRLPDVGPRGVPLQDTVTAAVRPAGPRRR